MEQPHRRNANEEGYMFDGCSHSDLSGLGRSGRTARDQEDGSPWKLWLGLPDYLTDSEGRRLCVSHDREVVVVDLDSEAIIGSVPGTRIHGIAIDREPTGFISASDRGPVTVFDLKTLAPTE